MSTRTIHDPFLDKTVEISNRLTDRLRGRYANGPTMPNGEPEFGWNEFPTPPIQQEAADEIDRLQGLLAGRERVVFTEESGPSNYLKLVASGDVDETMLEALEDYVKHQKKRLGIGANDAATPRTPPARSS